MTDDLDPAAQESPRGAVRDGTAQPDRHRPPLDDDYFCVDETSLAGLIAMTARFAANVRFEPSLESRESWEDLYVGRPVLAAAQLCSVDFRRELDRLSMAEEDGSTAGLASLVPRWREALQWWGDALERDPGPNGRILGRRIRATLEGLEPDIEVAHRALSSAGSDASVAQQADASAHRVLTAIEYLRPEAVAALEEALWTGRHDPALGLSLAFLHLFRAAQDELNAFTRRRLEFYYFDLLGFQARGRVPDRAHLALDTAPGVADVTLPAGTEFSGGRDENNEDLVFRSTEELRLTDARVESVRTLLLEKDPLVSPERELGYVTGLRAHEADRKDMTEPRQAPLFGERVDGGTTQGTRAESELGFAVASPLLLLREGTRRVRFHISLARRVGSQDRGGGDGASGVDRPRHEPGTRQERPRVPLTDRASLEEALQGCSTTEEFAAALGEAFACELMSATPWLSRDPRVADDPAVILREAERVLGRDSNGYRVVERLLGRERGAVFHELFQRSLTAWVSTAKGWHEAEYVHITQASEGMGLIVEIDLSPDVDPVVAYDPAVHGAGYDTEHPVVRFRTGSFALFHPYSLLLGLDVQDVSIEARVEGVSDLVAFNRFGPLDPTKTFEPFGPLPSRDADFVVGSYEAGIKPLSRAWLSIEWDELPRQAGGWRHHYAAYDAPYTNESFAAELTVSRSRRWVPAEVERRGWSRLFDAEPDGRLLRGRVISLDGVLDFHKPLAPGVSEEDFRSAPRDQDGLFRLSLEGSEHGFGHAEYPAILRHVVSENVSRKRKAPLPEPNAPYTPSIRRITLNYVSKATITLSAPAPSDRARTHGEVFHDYPSGARALSPDAGRRRFSLMPGGPAGITRVRASARGDGYLFLGLSGTRVSGPLSLLFKLVRGSAPRFDDPSATLEWYYLASNEWHPIERRRVVRDTTEGLRRSGIVLIDVPDRVDRSNTVFPPDLTWIAVGGVGVGGAVSRLHSVHVNGVSVEWEDRGNARPRDRTGLPEGTIQAPLAPIAGLGDVRQVGDSFGGRPAEDDRRVITRAGERLRHKNRSSTGWDFERIVLERFPSLYKVKCLPCVDVEQYPEAAPGSVLVVVVPRLEQPPQDAWRMRRVGAFTLAGIEEELRSIASPAARVQVRNPAYETVQVRCTVRFDQGAQEGMYLERLNQALIDFIAPWREEGRGGRFGWSIREKDVAAFIHDLPYVEFVTDVSLLHISQDESRIPLYRRDDTAVEFEETAVGFATDPGEAVGVRSSSDGGVRGRYPWSLAVPSVRHFIETTTSSDPIPAKITGIGELEVGQNFILEP